MVKHGRNKKRRAGRIGKTKIKNPWERKPKIADPIVKKHWDFAKSPAANLRSMGLSAMPNKWDRGNRQPGENPAEKAESKNIIELYDVPDSDKPKERRHPLDEEDEIYISKCIDKYGEDYTSMFRDIKLNNMQHTEAKLRKLGARYLLLRPEQRRVDVPNSVKPLLQASN